MMNVRKRDGRVIPFDINRIINAVLKAMKSSGKYSYTTANSIGMSIEDMYNGYNEPINICDIEKNVFDLLVGMGYSEVARAYESYRSVREFQRNSKNTIDKELHELLGDKSEYWKDENSNKDSLLVSTKRDYMAGVVSKDLAQRYIFSTDVIDAHNKGIIHVHDMDYTAQRIHNCELINLEDMLQNGTVINGVRIDKPHRLLTATTIATQIILAVTSMSYGGASVCLGHLAPFVRDSKKYYLNKYLRNGIELDTAKKLMEIDIKKEVEDSVQTFNYQLNSMVNVNGQSPFLSVYMYTGEEEEYKEELAMLIEEFFIQRIDGMKNEAGQRFTAAFPKLLYVLDEDNITDDAPYWYLTKLAAKCTAKRMVPDYISAKVMRKNKGAVYSCMGCRSFLTPDRTKDNLANANNWVYGNKYWGRFNCGVVTINLPDVALSSGGDVDLFWQLLNERMELCHKAHKERLSRLFGTVSDVAPILWQHGALARLKSGETIDRLIKNGYATVSLGYAGLYECVKYMTGHSHTDGDVGERFGLEIMQALSDVCDKWKNDENIDYSPYGTPIESTTYKFAKCLQDRFGVIRDVTDHNYITNSYHVNVREEIDPFTKLQIESRFQKLSAGGFISYIESANMTNNIEALLQIIKYIYHVIGYAEINTKSDYCHVCGYEGEFEIFDNNGKLDWRCPSCGNTNHSKMNITRRVCGYLSTNFFNQGRTQEIKERYVHLDDHEIR